MDRTPGGTMTPPHDEDAPCDDFAPVIPLRRRQPDPDPTTPTENTGPDSPGIWDPDAPLADLTTRSPAGEQPTAPDLLIPPAAAAGERGPTGGREATATAPHRRAGPRRLA